MASDYEAIKADNKRRYGTDVGRYGKSLLADLYDDRTHFIYELLQNAEDALRRRGDEPHTRTVAPCHHVPRPVQVCPRAWRSVLALRCREDGK